VRPYGCCTGDTNVRRLAPFRSATSIRCRGMRKWEVCQMNGSLEQASSISPGFLETAGMGLLPQCGHQPTVVGSWPCPQSVHWATLGCCWWARCGLSHPYQTALTWHSPPSLSSTWTCVRKHTADYSSSNFVPWVLNICQTYCEYSQHASYFAKYFKCIMLLNLHKGHKLCIFIVTSVLQIRKLRIREGEH
jgi:hypothetical protein